MARAYVSNDAELLSRLTRAGPSVLEDFEVLRIAAQLTDVEAVGLADEFGSIAEALAADVAALSRRLPPLKAAYVAMLRDLVRRALETPLRERSLIAGWTQVSAYLRGVLRGLPREQLRVLFLDRRNRLIRDEVMGEGSVDHVPVYPREILRRALELNASALVLAHNHPAGHSEPSADDIAMTRQVVEAGRALRISLHDHVLIAGDDVVSFRGLGLL